MEKELRRSRDKLVIAGTGFCIFGLWGIIKTVMDFILNREEIKETLNVSGAMMILIFAVTLFIMLIVVALHLFVGFSARSEGLYCKKHIVYLIFAVIMGLFYILSIASAFQDLIIDDFHLLQFIVSVMMNLTAVITIAEIIIESVKSKRLSKRLAEQESV